MRVLRCVLLAVSLCLLPACETISLVKAGPVSLEDGERLALRSPWSDITRILPETERGVRVLSKDGPLLNRLYVAPRIIPGRGLVQAPNDERTSPTYRLGMAPSELVEFVGDSIAALGYRRVEAGELAPGRQGGHDAIRIEFKALDASGLEFSAVAQIAEIKGSAYLILFLAPSEHYFPASRQEVEAILSSTN